MTFYNFLVTILCKEISFVSELFIRIRIQKFLYDGVNIFLAGNYDVKCSVEQDDVCRHFERILWGLGLLNLFRQILNFLVTQYSSFRAHKINLTLC